MLYSLFSTPTKRYSNYKYSLLLSFYLNISVPDAESEDPDPFPLECLCCRSRVSAIAVSVRYEEDGLRAAGPGARQNALEKTSTVLYTVVRRSLVQV